MYYLGELFRRYFATEIINIEKNRDKVKFSRYKRE